MGLTCIAKRSEPKPSSVFDTYWRFAAERQMAYYRRLRGDAVLTTDPILAAHRFTNCFRAADRVSQYLIRNAIYTGDPAPREVIFRVLLFKIFNKISTWETICRSLEASSSRVPRWSDLPDVAMALDAMRGRNETVYSAAYVMPSPGNATVKHRVHLLLLDSIIADCEKIASAKSLQALYEVLLAVPSFGPFLAYQFTIDLNYSALFDFDEDDFVVPGPGARDGLRKCFSDFGGYSEADIIRWVCDRQEVEFARLGLEPVRLFGAGVGPRPSRRLHAIDVQNLFCEVDKYARVAHPDVKGRSGRMKIKQAYHRDKVLMPEPFFPPKWSLE